MSNSSSNNGSGVLGLLGIAFVVLKLTNVIDWSWWYVTLPFWGGLVLFLIGLFIYGCILLIVKLFKKRKLIDKLKDLKQNNKPRKSKFQKRLDQLVEDRKNKLP